MNPENRAILPKIAFTTFNSKFRKPTLAEGFQDITEVEFQVSLTNLNLLCYELIYLHSLMETRQNGSSGANIGLEYRFHGINMKNHRRVGIALTSSWILSCRQHALYTQQLRIALMHRWKEGQYFCSAIHVFQDVVKTTFGKRYYDASPYSVFALSRFG